MSTAVQDIMSDETEAPLRVAGMLAEFHDVDSVFTAAEKVREAGYTVWDVHSPFPIHGIDDAIGIKPTILPWMVLGMGVFGMVGGLVMQCWMNGIDYQYLISGKPFFSIPAFIPVTFECTILCAAYTAVFGMFLLNKLPCLYNPLFKVERFRRATQDRFFIVIDAKDPKFDEDKTETFLNTLKPAAIETYDD